MNKSKQPIDGAPEPRFDSENEVGHLPVLAEETLSALDPKLGQVYVDLTAGRGGHAALVAQRLGATGRVILFDVDAANLAYSAARVEAVSSIRPHTVHASFASVARELERMGVVADLVLADLGFASNQVDDPARGLSFMREGPLDMRLDPAAGMTAAHLVNTTSERDLADILQRYGEEPLGRKIAAKIVAARRDAPILNTVQLADLVRSAYGARAHTSRLHPATKTFQALRIAVNDELSALSAMLGSVSTAARRVHDGRPSWLACGARVAIIGFHSLEDRLVKQCFVDMRKNDLAREITDGALVSSDSESAANPRSRSAKLRAAMVGHSKMPEKL